MSLFQFGFSISSTRQQTPHAPENITLAASHLPDKEDTILGRNEYNQVAAAVVDLARPQPSQSRSKRSKYLQYSGEDRAKIAEYSCEHGNTKALQHFSKEYPNLKESTLRNFKKAYQDKLKVIQRQEGNVQQVTSLESLPRGRPPLLLELDCKLISFVKNLRARGGVVNGSVISAAAKGLIRSNPSLHQRYNSFEPTRVTFLGGQELQQGHQFPGACMKSINFLFSLTLTNASTSITFHQSSYSMQIRPQVHMCL